MHHVVFRARVAPHGWRTAQGLPPAARSGGGARHGAASPGRLGRGRRGAKLPALAEPGLFHSVAVALTVPRPPPWTGEDVTRAVSPPPALEMAAPPSGRPSVARAVGEERLRPSSPPTLEAGPDRGGKGSEGLAASGASTAAHLPDGRGHPRLARAPEGGATVLISGLWLRGGLWSPEAEAACSAHAVAGTGGAVPGNLARALARWEREADAAGHTAAAERSRALTSGCDPAESPAARAAVAAWETACAGEKRARRCAAEAAVPCAALPEGVPGVVTQMPLVALTACVSESEPEELAGRGVQADRGDSGSADSTAPGLGSGVAAATACPVEDMAVGWLQNGAVADDTWSRPADVRVLRHDTSLDATHHALRQEARLLLRRLARTRRALAVADAWSGLPQGGDAGDESTPRGGLYGARLAVPLSLPRWLAALPRAPSRPRGGRRATRPLSTVADGTDRRGGDPHRPSLRRRARVLAGDSVPVPDEGGHHNESQNSDSSQSTDDEPESQGEVSPPLVACPLLRGLADGDIVVAVELEAADEEEAEALRGATLVAAPLLVASGGQSG